MFLNFSCKCIPKHTMKHTRDRYCMKAKFFQSLTMRSVKDENLIKNREKKANIIFLNTDSGYNMIISVFDFNSNFLILPE